MLEDSVATIENTYLEFKEALKLQFPHGVPAPTRALPVFTAPKRQRAQTMSLLNNVDSELHLDQLSTGDQQVLASK